MGTCLPSRCPERPWYIRPSRGRCLATALQANYCNLKNSVSLVFKPWIEWVNFAMEQHHKRESLSIESE
jgi:hypothetical protein